MKRFVLALIAFVALALPAFGQAFPVTIEHKFGSTTIPAKPTRVVSLGFSGHDDILALGVVPIAIRWWYGDYGVPWDISAHVTGLALGEPEKADAMIADIKAKIAGVAAAHPDWQGKTAAVAFYWNDAPGAYRSIDPRAHLLEDFGFRTPDAINAAGAADAFFVSLSAEDLTPLDTDVLIWFDAFENIDKLKLRTALKAHAEGREIFSDDLLSGAFSHSSLLSLPYAIDNLVPLIELAADGDPATVVPGSEGE
jgi:iron complex transport system substrate-binding protein